jgi:hypothetical protein
MSVSDKLNGTDQSAYLLSEVKVVRAEGNGHKTESHTGGRIEADAGAVGHPQYAPGGSYRPNGNVVTAGCAARPTMCPS